MKRFAFLGLLVAIALLSVTSVTKAEMPCGVCYDHGPFDGALTVNGAEGRVVTAICSDGFIVFQGVANGNNFQARSSTPVKIPVEWCSRSK